MSALIQGIPFNTDEQLDCFSLSLESLLRFYGLELALLHFDEWHFGLQGSDPEQFQIRAGTRDWAASLARFGVELRQRQEADFTQGWASLRAELDQGRPALVLMDTLPLRAYYYPGRPLHSLHTVVVNGYEGDQAFIVDPSPYTAFAGAIPLEIFAQAWQASALGRAAFTWCSLRVPEHIVPRAAQELEGCLRENTEGMLEGKTQRHLDGAAGWGIAGLRRLAGWMEEATAWPAAQTCQLLAQATQIKWVGLARRKHAPFLAHAAQVLGRPALAALGAELEAVAQEWMVARNLALKGCRRAGEGVVERLGRRLWALAEWEELLLMQLGGESR